jgi:DNA-binding LytR/AlgR family response regulator
MEVLLIEDEMPARERLKKMIRKIDPSAKITAETGSVRDTLHWLDTHSEPDLIIVDVQLSDGVSFDIFEQHPVQCPLLFTTAYDEYILHALRHNGIDYLLKPIKQPELQRALKKYRDLKAHFTGNLRSVLEGLKEDRNTYKSRFTVKKGTGFTTVRAEDVAFFYTEHKLVFLVVQGGEKYVLDRPLYELEQLLDPQQFFRLNRKYLVNVEAIRQFQPYHRGKLQVHLDPPVAEEVIVSQEKASSFKAWLEEEGE